MSDSTLFEAMQQLDTAEEFLDFFGIAYVPAIVAVKRLHILQRFREQIEARRAELPVDEEGQRAHYQAWLQRAYQEFVDAGARHEKGVGIFARGGPHSVFVPLSEIFK
jgi:nitrogenase-stabilizing/protective protein